MLSRLVAWVSVVGFSAGCATTQVALPGASGQIEMRLAEVSAAPVDQPRGTVGREREAVVRRVDERIRPAVRRVCRRYFGAVPQCTERFAGRSVTVAFNDDNRNAYIDGDDNIAVLGGLVAWSGSDDELAFVLAHEYSHGLFGHVRSRMSNSLVGALVGAGAAGALGAWAGAPADDVTDIATDGATIGAGIGGLVFTKSMELEADHMAMFIVDDAGYDVEKGMDFFQRSIRYETGQRRTGGRGRIGFFQTHPSDRDRLLNQLATIEAIRGGAVAPERKGR